MTADPVPLSTRFWENPKWAQIIMFLTSFSSALGNVVFVMLSRDQTQAYVKAYNIGSSTLGLLTLLILPLYISAYSLRRVTPVFLAISVVATGAAYFALGSLYALVFALLLLTLSFEYFVIRTNDVLGVVIFRVMFLITGFLPAFVDLSTALIIRVVLLGVIYGVGVRTAIRKDGGDRATVLMPKLDYIIVNILNVAWVYALPLILIDKADGFQAKIIYLVSNVFPLIFFKIEDTILKIDVFSSIGSSISSRTILKLTGIALSVGYLVVWALAYYLNFFDQTLVGLYVALSIVATFINIVLMNRIVSHNKLNRQATVD